MFQKSIRFPVLGTAVLIAATVSASMDARAEGFALYEYSARGIALGGGMMARKPDPSVIAYNPAQITRLLGTQMMGGGSIVAPGGKMRTRGPNAGDNTETELKDSYWAMPHGYFTQQINDDWFFGIGSFSRFGLGFQYPRNWPGRYNIYEVTLLSASVNPNIAYKVTDDLSIAAGVEAVWVNLDMRKKSQFLPGTDIDSNIRDANDIGWGFNVAGHYQINDEWAFGAQYRSQVRVNAFGSVRMSGVGPMAAHVPEYRGQANSSVKLPDSVAFGLAWTPRSDLSFEAGAVWTRWSKFNALDISFPGISAPYPSLAPSQKDWEDVWRINVSAEYDWNDWLTLRAGYVYDESPMPKSTQDYLVPTDGRHIWSGGAGIRYENWNFDLSYAYIDPIARSYKSGGAPGVLDSKMLEGYTHVVSFSASYKF